MNETKEPGSPTSAGSGRGSGRPAGGVPPVVPEVVHRVSETLRLGVFVALLAAVTFVLGVLVVLGWAREPLALYVLGGK